MRWTDGATGSAGPTWVELCSTLAVVPVNVLTITSLQRLSKQSLTDTHLYERFSPPAIWTVVSIETAGLLLPTVFVVLTRVTSAVVNISLAGALTVQIASLCTKSPVQMNSSRVLHQLALPRPRYVSWYRGSVMLWTCLCILAVDFNSFPARFKKAYAYGTGVMDVGVGSFIFCSAIVRKASSPQNRKQGASVQGWNLACRAVLPTLSMGFARLVATKVSGYPVEASEYGVHWNFFFTLAGVATLSQVTSGFGPQLCFLAGVLCLVAQQAMLSAGGADVAHASQRGPSLWSLNKEGLLSLPGYCSLSLLSRSLATCLAGSGLLSPAMHSARWQLAKVGLAVVAVDAALWVAAAGVHVLVQPVSRRACNAAYVLWSLALNLAMLALFAVVDAMDCRSYPARASGGGISAFEGGAGQGRGKGPSGDGRAAGEDPVTKLVGGDAGSKGGPGVAWGFKCKPDWEGGALAEPLPVLSAINAGLLPVFVLANLMTGLVNMAIDTHAVSDVAALVVVSIYMAVLCAAALCMAKLRSKAKVR